VSDAWPGDVPAEPGVLAGDSGEGEHRLRSRAFRLEWAGVALGLVVLAVGLALFIPAARKRAHALSRERAAAAWVAKVHEHRVQASARGATLRAIWGSRSRPGLVS
jgi:hypothetical protein